MRVKHRRSLTNVSSLPSLRFPRQSLWALPDVSDNVQRRPEWSLVVDCYWPNPTVRASIACCPSRKLLDCHVGVDPKPTFHDD
jgi:hypothetical protein